MRISVLPCEWGSARPADIQNLLHNVASHIEKELRDPFQGDIEVMNLPGSKEPRTHYRNQNDPPNPPPGAAYPINLTAKDRYWCMFAYQFAHEFCHVLSGYERLHGNPNNWFHESICEMASIFVLRRMGERWQHQPPYENWTSYSASLTKYADDQLRGHECLHASKRPPDFHVWLLENEADLRANPYLRDRNGVVASKLLLDFEQEPGGWNAIRRLPSTAGNIREYVESWQASVDAQDRGFVEGIAASLGLVESTG